MVRDYDRDRWGRRYDDEVERYDRDDRRQRMRSDLDYSRERGMGGGYDRERGMGQYGARSYSDNEMDYRRDDEARRSDLDYGYGGRRRVYDRPRDYGRDVGARGWRGADDERLRYRGDDRETGRRRYASDYDRDRYASDYDRNRYSREDDRARARRDARDDSWVEQVPDHYSRRGPYEDYGWEAGESVLPQFRDPSVHETDYERRRDRRDDRNDRSWWERTR